MPRENRQAGCGCDLKHRNRRACVHALAFFQSCGKLVIGNEITPPWRTYAKALAEPDQVRRCVRVHALSGSLQNCPQKRDGRSFAIGAGHMNGFKFPLRVAQVVAQRNGIVQVFFHRCRTNAAKQRQAGVQILERFGIIHAPQK